jgi:glycosyltransferase involved in cell wall biosynthesis
MATPQSDTTPSLRVTGVIFSKDRPLQLDATLRSLKRHCQDLASVSTKVIYAASSSRMLSLYRQLIREHPTVDFVHEQNFRRDLLLLLKGWEFVLFLVDDNVFVRDFTMAGVILALRQNPDAIGFSLRLGRNTTYCYSWDKPQKLPLFQRVDVATLKFKWPDAELDFNYPLEVSSSVYRGGEMAALLESLDFKNPNTLEAAMAGSSARFREQCPYLLCPEQSLAFCIPVNVVQQVYQNRASVNPEYSVEALAKLFSEGQRMDVEALDNFIPQSCHQEMEFKLSRTTVSVPFASPLVSVVIPCYKQAHFLPEAVESVVAQTFRDWEIIVVNDGSPDNTNEVARALIERHPDCDIRLLEKGNGGLSDARNAGIAVAQGEYVLPLDADDRLAPTMLEKTVAVLDSRPPVGFAYSDIQHFGLQDDLYRLPEFDADTIVYADNIACVCALVRLAAWKQVGGYNANMKEGYEDWDFWVGCIEKGWQGYRIPEPLFHYRKTKGSMLSRANQVRERLIARIVLNHPELYSPERVHRAELMIQGNSAAAKPRRILLACTHFWPSIGGLETIVGNLANHLVKRGYEVAVAALSHPDRHFSMHRGIQIISLNAGAHWAKQPKAANQLSEFVSSGQYDACVLFADPLNWVFWSLDNVEIPSSTRVIAQPIINADGYGHWKDDLKFRSRFSKLLRRFHAVVAISTNGQEVKFLREEGIPFAYIPNATEPENPELTFRQRFNLAEDETILLHVANLWRVKNHLGLMNAISFLPGKWRLVMIGHPSEDADYVRQVRDAAARDRRFLLIPGLSHDQVAAAMAAADIVLLASHGEVSPVTILEAMSHGKPWLATPECGAVHDNAGGIIAPLERFSSILQVLIIQPELRHKLGRLGWEHWNASFTWKQVTTAWEQLIFMDEASVSFEMPLHLQEAMVIVKEECNLAHKLMKAVTKVGPKVSIIVPTYNRPVLLAEALKSILNQSLQDFEIIVVNDGGIDVESVVSKLNARRNIVYLNHDTLRGPASARNTGLRAACGKYVAYLDDDDVFLPDHLETLVGILESTGQAVAYTDAFCAQQKLEQGCYITIKRTIPHSNDWDNDRILYENFVPTLCFMHERECIFAVGGFDEFLTTNEDWDLWIRLSRSYEIIHINKATCEFRRRGEGTSMTSSKRYDFARTLRIIYKKYQTFAGGKPNVLKKQGDLLQSLPTDPNGKTRTGMQQIIHQLLSPKWRRSVCKRLASVNQWFQD